MVDKRRAPLIIEAFKLYAGGNKTMQDISDFLYREGGMTKGKNPWAKTKLRKYWQTRFIMGILDMLAKSTKANTLQSSASNYMTARKPFLLGVATHRRTQLRRKCFATCCVAARAVWQLRRKRK